MVDHASNPEAAVARVRNEIDAALALRNRPAAVGAALQAIRSGSINVPDLYLKVLTPLLVDTGASWSRGETQIWEEHYASSTVRTIIEALYLDVQTAAEQIPSNGKVAVLACPSGEAHELGLRMLTDRLTLAGWDAHYLGADTPTAEIIAAAKALKADIVALSAATHYNRVLLCEVVDQLAAALPDARIGAGGPSFAHCALDERHRLSEADLGLDATKGA